MTATGEIAKGIFIFFCLIYLLAALGQAASGQTAMATFMLACFGILLLIVIYGYAKDTKNRKFELN